MNKSTARYYFHRLRLLIHNISQHVEIFDGEVEFDASYLDGIRKGKRGRGAHVKRIILSPSFFNDLNSISTLFSTGFSFISI